LRPGAVVHDYVPLYFCVRSPMLLAVINNKIADEQLIIYWISDLNIEDYPSVFSDASANTGTPPNFMLTLRICQVDWDVVDT